MAAGKTGERTPQGQQSAPETIRVRLRKLLAVRDEIDWAYLFGSFLGGAGYHDIDVGLYLHPPLPRDRIFDYEMALSAQLTMAVHKAVDVHVLNDAPLGFQHSALQGEPLFVRDQERLTDFIEQVGLAVSEFAHHAERYLQEVLT